MTTIETITEWMESDHNSEYFYLEEEEVRDGKVLVSAGGSFSFWVDVASSAVECKDTRAPVQSWFAKLKAMSPSCTTDVLVAATSLYKEISDELEQMDEDEMDAEDEDDHEDHILVAETKAKVVTQEQIEKERLFDELLKTLKTSTGSQSSTDRILNDYKNIYLSKSKVGWDATPINGDIFKWQVRIFDFEKGTDLYNDVEKLKQQTGRGFIDMVLTFPEEYPFKPPFLRIIRPRFQFMTGRVTIGGSICHELLTNKGWKPVNDIESIIETVRAEITDPEAKARLDLKNTTDYQV